MIDTFNSRVNSRLAILAAEIATMTDEQLTTFQTYILSQCDDFSDARQECDDDASREYLERRGAFTAAHAVREIVQEEVKMRNERSHPTNKSIVSHLNSYIETIRYHREQTQ